MQKIGAHVSAAGGVRHAPLNAKEEGCETFQFFLNPPQTYAFKPLADDEVAAFNTNCKELGFDDYWVHASYLMNLASLQNKIRHGSISLLKKTLVEGSKIGVKGVMFHTGSAKDHPDKATAIKKAIESINIVLDGYTGSTKLLIENAAGAGGTLGVTFEEVGLLYKGIKNKAKAGVCLDTQHAFASGYDWRTPKGTAGALATFDKVIGLKNLAVIQVNDSKVECGANRDRHEHIAEGKIGADGMRNILRHPKLKNHSFILETPPEGRPNDLATLKKLRAK